MIRDKPRIKTDRAIQGRVSTRTIEAAWLESLRRLASMYPETASFPVQERRHLRSRNSTCEADNRGLCGPGTRIGNKGCFRGDAFFVFGERTTGLAMRTWLLGDVGLGLSGWFLAARLGRFVGFCR